MPWPPILIFTKAFLALYRVFLVEIKDFIAHFVCLIIMQQLIALVKLNV